MTQEKLPRGIEVYEIGSRRLYVKTGARNFSISEEDVTPEELVAIAEHISSRGPVLSKTDFSVDFVPVSGDKGSEVASGQNRTTC
jgi:hypothetical protein